MRFLPRLRLGIASKLALSLAALLLLATLAIGLLVYWNAEQLLKDSAADQLNHVSDVVDLRLQNEMMSLREDIRFLAASPMVQQVAAVSSTRNIYESPVGSPEQEALHTLDTVFTAFLQHHPQYFQVRLIGQQDDGREVVRVERRDNAILVTPPDSLQQKGNRTYFREAIGLPHGSLYISDINLNRELGIIEQPEIPTVRAAIPLFDTAENVLGIVVINVDFGYVLRQLQTLVPETTMLYLTNQNGDFLLHPDSTLMFGFERGQPHRIQEEFPASRAYLQTANGTGEIVDLRPDVLFLRRFPLERGISSDMLFLGLSAPYETIFAGVYSVQRNTMLVMLLFCMIAIGLAVAFSHVHTRPLRRIRREAEHLGQNGDPLRVHDLPVERTDEIGVLARTFDKMSKRLDAQMIELHHAHERAEKASKLKTVFLTNMSHEIRTPLTVMVGFGDLLARDLHGEHKTLAEGIVQGGRRLTETLVSVLTLAELEAEGMTLEPQPLALAPTVTDIASLFRWEAQRKGLTLNIEIHPAAQQIHIYVDRAGLASVLQNLIGNAIKFTMVGGIIIRVERRRHEAIAKPRRAPKDEVLIHVEDTGVGISEDFFATLFEPFTQESTGYTRAYEGSGLGLSIAKQLTEKMGGTISVQSQKGKGSRFTLRFPQLQAKKTPRHETVPPDTTPPASRLPAPKRVLVVEDNEETSYLMEKLLEKDYDVKTANTAKDALDKLQDASTEKGGRFDAILMDINLGDGPSGRDVLQKLRKLPSLALIPVAAVTAYALPGDREQLLSEGFTAYLRKPFMPNELQDLVSGLISRG